MSCLDSWAVLAWLDGEEPARNRVDVAFLDSRPLMSWLNLVEVHYRVSRDHGDREATRTVDEIRRVVDAELPGVVRMREVARLKAIHPIAMADCFAIATAASAGVDLMTGDPEIVDLRDSLPCEVTDCRLTP